MLFRSVPGMGTSSYAYNITSGMTAGYWSEQDTDPKGNITIRVYNPSGRLYQVKSGNDTTTYTYLANGNRATVTYPNGIVTTYTYYDDNRLHTLANKLGNTFIGTYNYAYDGNGNILTKLELSGTTTYTYDDLGRLLTVAEPSATTAYTYDDAGNRATETTTRNSETVVTTYTYDAYNQMTETEAVEASSGDITATQYTYDDNGNNISRTIVEPDDTENSTLYEYDDLNRLVGVDDDEYTASYTYNTAGLRTQKSVTANNVTTTEKFLTDGGNIVLETNSSGTQLAYDVYGPEGIISRKTSAGTLYYLYNGHGDVVQLTNSSGNAIISYTYDAFGNMTSNSANDTNPFRYCGEYFDLETETYYLRARYYSPATGRFTQRDSFGGYYNDPLSLNRYTYVSNNPLKYKDPSGHWQQGDEKYTYETQQKILEYTNAYNNATTVAAKTAANKAAEALRVDTNLKTNSTVPTTVSTSDQQQLNQVANQFNAAVNSGNSIYVNPDQWKAMVSNAGIKTETSAPITTHSGTPASGYPAVFTTSSAYVDSTVTSTIKQTSSVNAAASIKVTSNKKSTSDISDGRNGLLGIDTAALGAFFLMMFEDENGIYHASTEAWQQVGGYNRVYDAVFEAATSMKAQPFEFTDEDGQDYVLWAWKGDYLNLGAGAELGIYKRQSVFGVDTDHWAVDRSLALPMTMWLNYEGKTIASYYPSESQWWITSFNPDYKDVMAGDLTAMFTVDFSSNRDMYDAFQKNWDKDGSPWVFYDRTYSAFLAF